jgi:hypothetical protein
VILYFVKLFNVQDKDGSLFDIAQIFELVTHTRDGILDMDFGQLTVSVIVPRELFNEG